MARLHDKQTLQFDSSRACATAWLVVFALSSIASLNIRAQSPPTAKRASTQTAKTDSISEGIAAYERSDFASARAAFEKALILNPRDVTAHTYLGIIADGANDLTAAEKHFAFAARLAPASASARNNYGAILLKLHRVKEAAAEFDASLKIDGRQANALVNLAQIHFASGTPADLRAARELFARAYAIAPDTVIARALIVIALRLDDRAAAANYYREYAARGANDKNSSTLNAASRAELGGALFEAGLLFEAETELKAALALDASNKDAVLRLAQTYLARKDIPSAGRTLEAAVARGLDGAAMYALLAAVYEQSGHYENAIPAMRLAIERAPQSENYRFRYGMLLTDALAPAAAVIRLKEALQTFPNSSKLWFALGLANFKWNKNDEARRAFARSIELDSKYAPAYAYLGMTHVETGQYAEAVSLYEKALRANANLAVVHYLIADVLLKEANADNARVESELKKSVALDATFAPARLTLGKLYIRMERWSDAAAELQQVIRLDPNLAEAYYQLGRVYGRLKRTADAQTVLAKFKTLSEQQKEKSQDELREIVRRLADVRF